MVVALMTVVGMILGFRPSWSSALSLRNMSEHDPLGRRMRASICAITLSCLTEITVPVSRLRAPALARARARSVRKTVSSAAWTDRSAAATSKVTRPSRSQRRSASNAADAERTRGRADADEVLHTPSNPNPLLLV